MSAFHGSGAQARYADDLFPAAPARKPWPFAGLDAFSYDLIMADPPWRFELYSEKGEEKSPQAHYRTMSIEEIAGLRVRNLGRPSCVLWLWCTWPLLAQQMSIVEAWGFRYVTGGAWVKRTVNGHLAFGTGYRLRSACEPFLIGVSGNPETARDVRNVVEAQVREHSRKPDAAFHAAERLMLRGLTHEGFQAETGRRCRLLELFSRERRAGWDTWGNEASKFTPDSGRGALAPSALTGRESV